MQPYVLAAIAVIIVVIVIVIIRNRNRKQREAAEKAAKLAAQQAAALAAQQKQQQEAADEQAAIGVSHEGTEYGTQGVDVTSVDLPQNMQPEGGAPGGGGSSLPIRPSGGGGGSITAECGPSIAAAEIRAAILENNLTGKIGNVLTRCGIQDLYSFGNKTQYISNEMTYNGQKASVGLTGMQMAIAYGQTSNVQSFKSRGADPFHFYGQDEVCNNFVTQLGNAQNKSTIKALIGCPVDATPPLPPVQPGQPEPPPAPQYTIRKIEPSAWYVCADSAKISPNNFNKVTLVFSNGVNVKRGDKLWINGTSIDGQYNVVHVFINQFVEPLPRAVAIDREYTGAETIGFSPITQVIGFQDLGEETGQIGNLVECSLQDFPEGKRWIPKSLVPSPDAPPATFTCPIEYINAVKTAIINNDLATYKNIIESYCMVDGVTQNLGPSDMPYIAPEMNAAILASMYGRADFVEYIVKMAVGGNIGSDPNNFACTAAGVISGSASDVARIRAALSCPCQTQVMSQSALSAFQSGDQDTVYTEINNCNFDFKTKIDGMSLVEWAARNKPGQLDLYLNPLFTLATPKPDSTVCALLDSNWRENFSC